MTEYIQDNIIYTGNTVLDALNRIETVKSHIRTLFVLSSTDHRMLGTLTDGDVRRFLISGGVITEDVSQAVNTEFRYLREDDKDIHLHLHELKALGVWIIPVLNKVGQIVDVVNLRNRRALLPVDAVLMAGGKGERLRPITEKTPKPLVKVGDKCIIDYNIERLIQFGVNHMNVAVNYLAEQIEEHFATPIDNVKVKTVREPKYLGTAGSIQFIDEFYNETIVLMNSDLFTDIDFEDFYLHFKEHNATMSVAAVPYNVSIPLGVLDLNGRDIIGLKEKPRYNYYANAGIYLLKKKALSEIPKDTFFNATDLIEKLIDKGEKVIRYPLNGTWIDIGQHADLAKAQEIVKHIHKF